MTSQISPTFGCFLKDLRKKNALTITELAALLKLDSANLSKIENNKRVFDEKRLHLVAEIFKIDLISIKKEYYSDVIATNIYLSDCDRDIIALAEHKIEYIKNKSK